MSTRYLTAGCAIAALVVGVGAGWLIGGNDSGPPSPTDAKESCLYAGVQTYPTWPVGNPPVLDSIAECAKLPVADRLELRQAMSAFVAQANARSQGG